MTSRLIIKKVQIAVIQIAYLLLQDKNYEI